MSKDETKSGTFLPPSLSLSLFCSYVRANVIVTSTLISIYACKQSIVDDGAGLIHTQTFVRERISCKKKERELFGVYTV